MKNVLIGGVMYGLHNIGDEAILLSILNNFSNSANLSVESWGSQWIHSMFPGVNVLPIRTMYTKPWMGLSATPRRKLLSSIRNSYFPDLVNFYDKDLFLCGGGTILSDCPWHSMRLIELAGRSGVPSVLWGIGMAQVQDAATLEYIRKVSNSDKVLSIFTRDEYVSNRLEDIGVRQEKIAVVYDPAIMLTPEDFDLSEYLSDYAIHHLRDGKKHICISLSGEEDVTDRQHIDAVRIYIEAIINEFDADVFLVPTGCGDHCMDRKLLKSLATKGSIIYIDREFAPRHLICFLQHMDLIISSRLHCNIFGAVASVPSIGLARNQKLIDFATLFDFPFFQLNQVRCDNLVRASRLILENLPQIRQRIIKQVAYMRAVHEAGVKQMIDKYLK